ncbi:hypothetical protein So717_16590 [Roseobacter cerasinus]|uniref:Uncharacterized protein n=2 Tax=Roseobacter cerasinus TaxID=2602289 RepID=A0A640VUK3_9RHOB|nr:hypothetical protein So717_16590 [Roseobacter cerasinus]
MIRPMIQLAIMLSPLVAAAQETSGPPRFDGHRNTASSSAVVGQVQSPAPGVTPQANALFQSLIGAAIDEAARTEGRLFVEERHEPAPPTTD